MIFILHRLIFSEIMGDEMIRALIGFLFSVIISFAALKKKSLSFSGFASATILGTALYFVGNIFFLAILIGFFISSSLLTKYKSNEKSVLGDINEKSGARDYIQVIANGGLGLIYASLYYLTKNSLFIFAYAASFSSANADTWSSEVGVLSKNNPISIITFKKAEKGTSGAVSLLGFTASILGSGFIGVIFFIGYILSFGWNINLPYFTIFVIITGFLGSIIDSYLGALIQAKYRCKVCRKITEKQIHHNEPTEHIHGFKFINNDVVNFSSSFFSSVIAVVLIMITIYH